METTQYKRVITDASKAIEKNTTLFYQQKQTEGFELLDSTLGLLIQATNVIMESKVEKNEIYKDHEEFNVVLSNAMKAIENRDTILLSDILYFDVKPLLDKRLL